MLPSFSCFLSLFYIILADCTILGVHGKKPGCPRPVAEKRNRVGIWGAAAAPGFFTTFLNLEGLQDFAWSATQDSSEGVFHPHIRAEIVLTLQIWEAGDVQNLRLPTALSTADATQNPREPISILDACHYIMCKSRPSIV